MRFAVSLIAFSLLAAVAADPTRASAAPIAPRVLVVVAFSDDGKSAPAEEAAPWVEREGLNRKIATVAALSLRCNATETVCLLISGIGKVNAATSLLALGLEPGIDLRRTYVIVSGIAGVSPDTGTIGTAAWATWVVDYDLAHEIDAREMPPAASSRFQQGCTTATWCGTSLPRAGTEFFELDPNAVRFAYGLTKNLVLPDPPFVRALRMRYVQAVARARPRVETCDIVAGDAYWAGQRFGAFSAAWMRDWTGGAGTYCMTSMEDVAFAAAMQRLAARGRVDYRRYFELRAGSDFDRPHPGQTSLDVLRAGMTSGTFGVAVDDAYLTSRVVVRYVVAHWSALRAGPPVTR